MSTKAGASALFALMLGGGQIVAGSTAMAQENGFYAPDKSACGGDPNAFVEIDGGHVSGPAFECELGEFRPAGTGLAAYTATCMIDGRDEEGFVVFDLGNYDDHFKMSLPDRKDWISLYPCASPSAR